MFHLSSFGYDLFLMYPLAVLSHLRSGFAYATSSVLITGMRGTKVGVSIYFSSLLDFFSELFHVEIGEILLS